MKKTTGNTINLSQLEHLIQLLEKGYTINDGIDLLANINGYECFIYLKDKLLNGESIESLLLGMYKEQIFTEMFSSLYPVKGLTYALKESLNMVKEKKKYVQIVRKKTTYPFILILIIVAFSLFVKLFLLPEINLLFQSFDYNHSYNFTYLTILLIPNLLLILFSLLYLIYTFLIYCVTFSKHISFCLKLPIISTIIKTYYSFKFSYYLSRLSSCFDNFHDTIIYFYQTNQNTDLKLVLETIYFQLEDGIDLLTIIKTNNYFTDDFKKLFYLLLSTKQQIVLIEDYCMITINKLENYLKTMTNAILAFVYLCTGLYIMSLYSLIIMPVLEITTLL